MPVFDPTKPAANALVSSSELRDEMNNSVSPVAQLPTAFTDLFHH